MRTISSRLFIIICLLAIGISLRFIAASLGFTYDMQSYEIVGKIVNAGGNVYQQTSRYNYGPLWFLIIGFFFRISRFFSDPFLFFRFFIVAFLTCVDLGIWYWLRKRYSIVTSFLFFLNPLSIILTGYYSQFDNVSILLGISSIVFYEKSKSKYLDTYFWYALVLMGLSLITKHIFFAFPLWLFFHEKNWKKKILILTVPVSLFLLSFVPFLIDGYNGIKQNVFLYKSFNNAPLWQALIPDYLKRYIRKEFLFAGTLLAGAFLFRNKKPFEQLLLYTLVLVTFSYAVADQYIAIVLPVISVYFNLFFLGFVLVQTIFFTMILLGGEVMWFSFLLDRSSFGFHLQMLFLFLGLLFMVYKMHFPKVTLRHITLCLFTLTGILYIGIIFPSWKEDREILPIMNAIKAGNYEQANTLYHVIEINPPFAGSRFYNKLSPVRFNIEFYRTYRYALDGYLDQSQSRNWKEIRKALQIVPASFPEKNKVQEILDYADQHL